MISRRRLIRWLGIICLMWAAACAGEGPEPSLRPSATIPPSPPAQEQATSPSPPSPSPRPEEGDPLTPSPTAHVEISLTASPATQTSPGNVSPSCPPSPCLYAGQFFLQRPIGPSGNQQVDVTYRFGSTQGRLRDPHHGVEFLNPAGTPVLAAADGVVVVAGDDRQPTSPRGVWPITFYGPYSYFYGNLVVIEHSLPPALQLEQPDLVGPIYTLYAHLSEISVQVGQTVQAGQTIGAVGMTGVATGPHLHFEVRLGENNYKSSRNPELWLIPRQTASGQPMGALAGRVLDRFGSSVELTDIVLRHLPNGPDQPHDFEVYLLTYEEAGLRGQPPFLESFAAGDLVPGWYKLTFPYYGLREILVQVFPGQLTVLTLQPE